MSDRAKGQSGIKLETEEEEIKNLLLGIMEGYNDTVIPPFSFFSPSVGVPNTENSFSERKRQNNEASRANSKLNERKKREEMSEKFSVLQSIVPTLTDAFKPSKEKIVNDTVNYIKYLEEEKQRLEGVKKLRCEGPKKTAMPVFLGCKNGNSSVKVTVTNGATFLAVQLPFRRGLVTEIVKVIEKHKAEVLETRICVDEQRMLSFTATIMLGDSTIDRIREEILTF